jgi:hypothetical protein
LSAGSCSGTVAFDFFVEGNPFTVAFDFFVKGDLGIGLRLLVEGDLGHRPCNNTLLHCCLALHRTGRATILRYIVVWLFVAQAFDFTVKGNFNSGLCNNTVSHCCFGSLLVVFLCDFIYMVGGPSSQTASTWLVGLLCGRLLHG